MKAQTHLRTRLLVSLALVAIIFAVMPHGSVSGQVYLPVIVNSPPTCRPAIEVTYLPPYGSFDDLQGRVTCANPADYMVAAFIYVAGWYNKPYWDAPCTTIGNDGAFTVDITTGGNDELATRIALFLLPNPCDPPRLNGAQSLPDTLFTQSVAHLIIERPAIYRTIDFSGYTWNVKASRSLAGPGPNYFSDRPEDVWVDEQGRLHLRIARHAGRWYATEVIHTQSLGYGIYTFTLGSRVDLLDPNVVLGLFSWDSTAPAHAYRELDIEFARWGDANTPLNAQFVVQPWEHAGNRHRFNLDLLDDRSIHRFDWQPDRVDFASFRHNPAGQVDELVENWQYTGPDLHPPGQENARINLWLLNGQPPTDGQEVEVIVEGFAFAPPVAAMPQRRNQYCAHFNQNDKEPPCLLPTAYIIP